MRRIGDSESRRDSDAELFESYAGRRNLGRLRVSVRMASAQDEYLRVTYPTASDSATYP